MNEKLGYDIQAAIRHFMNSFFESSKKNTDESKEEAIYEANNLVYTVISQNAIKAEEIKKKIKSEVLDELRKEIVTKDYVDQQFQINRSYVDLKFESVEQRTDKKIAEFKSDMIKWMLGVGVSATIVIVGANYTLITLLIDALKN